jgi:hypothetical protein
VGNQKIIASNILFVQHLPYKSIAMEWVNYAEKKQINIVLQ